MYGTPSRTVVTGSLTCGNMLGVPKTPFFPRFVGLKLFCLARRKQDTEETKFKQLQRQVKRERKGAMRELKRDAVFLEHAKADKTAEKERTRYMNRQRDSSIARNTVHTSICCTQSSGGMEKKDHLS